MQALSGCIPSVISCLIDAAAERNMEGRALLHGVMDQMATYKFVYLTYFLSDAIGILAILSVILQKHDITYHSAKPHLDSTVLALNSLLTTNGPYLQKFLKVAPVTPNDHGAFTLGAHEIKDSQKERDIVVKTVNEFITELTTQIENYFPDSTVMGALGILDPQEYPKDETKQAVYGEAELNLLTDYFNGDSESQPAVEKTALTLEWTIMKPFLAKHNGNMMQFFKEYIFPNISAYPNLAKLCAVAIVTPVTSVNCERGVSAYNGTKTDSRSSLEVSSTDRLLKLQIEAPHFREFDFDKAYALWYQAKDRRGMKELEARISNHMNDK